MKNKFPLSLKLSLFSLLFSFGLFAQDCPDSCTVYVPKQMTINCETEGCTRLVVETDCVFKKYEFSILTRWGNEIFHSEDPDILFDCANEAGGTYYWILKAKLCNGEKLEKSGPLMILK